LEEAYFWGRMKFPVLSVVGALLALSTVVSPSMAAAEQPAASRIQLPLSDEGLPGTGPIRRGEWFQVLWASRRGEWATSVAKDQGALVFLGDSITQGWWDVNGLFPGVKIANRGISGDTTRGVLIRLQEDVIALNPRAVVMLIGTNDIDDHATPETINGNLRQILTAFKAHNPKMPVVLLSVLPSSKLQGRSADTVRRVNALYRATAEEFEQVTLLDTWSLFADVQGDAKLEEMPDLLHPNGLGYAKMASALRPVLETLGLVPVWPDEFSPEAGYRPLFNTKDLSGWKYEGSVLDGQLATADGRYLARNGRLVVPASKKEHDYKKLMTVREYAKDFVLKLEFRASPNADSGVYIRGVQLQCRDYPVAGPFSNVRQYRAQDWNELVVTVRGNLAHATCNGEVIMDAMEIPASGPIGLESDRGQMEYRRIRIQTTE
jgi:lysophospholipase L1-like esterase